MQAKASIITQDLRLLERIFFQLREAFVNTVSSDNSAETISNQQGLSPYFFTAVLVFAFFFDFGFGSGLIN